MGNPCKEASVLPHVSWEMQPSRQTISTVQFYLGCTKSFFHHIRSDVSDVIGEMLFTLAIILKYSSTTLHFLHFVCPWSSIALGSHLTSCGFLSLRFFVKSLQLVIRYRKIYFHMSWHFSCLSWLRHQSFHICMLDESFRRKRSCLVPLPKAAHGLRQYPWSPGEINDNPCRTHLQSTVRGSRTF